MKSPTIHLSGGFFHASTQEVPIVRGEPTLFEKTPGGKVPGIPGCPDAQSKTCFVLQSFLNTRMNKK
tara:strand:- start:278 stop:478 length:201 start_codon:yes stop_codon:yes gene_type:complete